MKRLRSLGLAVASLAFALAACARRPSGAAAAPGVLLEALTWREAERALGPDTIVVLPLGAAAKEHGPHLPLDTDFLLAEYLKGRIRARSRVVVAPTITYSYYPSFLEYPGSISLRLETARDLVVDACRSLAGYGPRRFYVLNTGVTPERALAAAADALREDGILLAYTPLARALGDVEKAISEQAGGGHADELETSMMLFIAPAAVDMAKAAKDYDPEGAASPERRAARRRTRRAACGATRRSPRARRGSASRTRGST